MSYVKLSCSLINDNEWPGIIEALKEKFVEVKEVSSFSDLFRVFEVDGPEASGYDNFLDITFGKNPDGKVIIYNIDK